MPRERRPPDPRTVSTLVYLALLVIAVVLLYVAARAVLI
jgi:hypothetical protein